ncbi:hypothetical protein G9A89_005237 [Geosiphon pyriformis]|nr:hypothetical protein G9A89_005237 [Geosiphon pyriformis]
MTSVFGQFPFQSKQRKTELLGPYRIQSLPSQPDFETATLRELLEEEEEEESEDQEFTYQNLILENPEFGTPNI